MAPPHGVSRRPGPRHRVGPLFYVQLRTALSVSGPEEPLGGEIRHVLRLVLRATSLLLNHYLWATSSHIELVTDLFFDFAPGLPGNPCSSSYMLVPAYRNGSFLVLASPGKIIIKTSENEWTKI